MDKTFQNNYPLVTVFTLIYNTNPKYVIEAIESVRANNYPMIQHIIIDDCSPNTEPKNVVKEWVEKEKYSCEFYEHTENYGLCKTLNHVLELAKGKYICGCSDDVFMPNKIKIDIELLEMLPLDYSAIYSDAYLIDENSELLYGWFIQKFRQFNYLPEGYIFNHLIEGNFIPAMSLIWRTEALLNIGGFDENIDYEDYDMNLRLFKKTKLKLNPYPSVKYRIHENSLSHQNKKWIESDFQIFLKHQEIPEFKNKCYFIIKETFYGGNSTAELKGLGFSMPFIVVFLIKLIPKPLGFYTLKTYIRLFSRSPNKRIFR